MGVDERIFLPLPSERPNALRKTSTLLKNLNHHDKNPAPPPPPVQGNNLTLITKTYCIVLYCIGPQNISQPPLIKYFNPTPGKNLAL